MENIADIILQLKEIKKQEGYTNQQIADMSNVSKTTIDRVFNNQNHQYNFTYATIQPIVKAMIGFDEIPSQTPNRVPDSDMVQILHDIIVEKNSDIAALKSDHKEEIKELREEQKHHNEKQQLLIDSLKRSNSIQKSMIIIILLIILILVVIDFFSGNAGWMRF